MRITFAIILAACGAAPKSTPTNVGPNASIELTWIVYPVDPKLINDQDYPLAPLDLMVGSERLKLEPQMGAFNAAYQSVCHLDKEAGHAYPLARDEVAKIAFYEGGAGGYVVKRVGGKLALFTWAQGDGLCGETTAPIECPTNPKQVRVLDVPATAKVVERLLVVDAAGKQAPLDCSKPYANSAADTPTP